MARGQVARTQCLLALQPLEELELTQELEVSKFCTWLDQNTVASFVAL